MTRSRYSATVDPITGTGGVADIFKGMYAEGLPESSVTVPKGQGQGPLIGGFSAVNNAEAYRNGQTTASQATANTWVDTGVGLGADATGAAIGATIGSIIPGAGIAIGAGLSRGRGRQLSCPRAGRQERIHRLGQTGTRQHALGAEKPLGTVWNGISTVTHPIAEGASTLYHGAANALNGAGSALSNGAGRLWNWMTK